MKRSCFYYTIFSSLFVLLNSVSLQDLFAQTQFRDVTNQPVLSYGSAGEWDDGAVWFPSVIKDGDTLRMWYPGLDNTVWQDPLYKIGYAWSLDGIIWNKSIGNPVLGPELSWEGQSVGFCEVIKDMDTLKMWYGAGSIPGRPPSLIGYATSFDGITWSKHPDPVIQLGPTLDWDDDMIAPHSVIKEDDVYNMWYWAARPGFPSAESLPQIGMATSPDGIHWTKYDDPITTEAPFAESDPVLKVGSTSDWDAIRVINPIVLSTESGYEMWYSGCKAPITTSTKLEIGYATSADGIQWTKSPDNPVIPDYSFSWGKAIYGGSILKYDGDYHFWFACFHTPPTQARPQIGYAESYEPAWNQMKSMDIERGRLRSCEIESMIYVFGGQGTNGVNIDSVDVYNTETNEWTNLTPMPEHIAETNVEVIHDTMIYIVGGWTDVNGHNQKTTNSTLEFDPEKESYLAMKDCPIATGSNASCVLNDTLYILGGKDDFNSTDVKKAWFYDPNDDNWDTISTPDMIYPHGVDGSACVLDGNIYVIGGTNALDPLYPTQAEMYDGKNWAPIAEMPVPVLHHVTIIHNNKILVFGGDSGRYAPNGYTTNLIQEYDPSANSWRLMQGMPFNRSAMTGEKVGNYLYLMGGHYSNDLVSVTAVSEVWRFNLDSLKAFISVSGISLDQHSLELPRTETATLLATVSPADASDPSLSWTSGDAAVATVENGTVTGVANGQTYIYVTSDDGQFMDSCQITIIPGVGIANSKADRLSIFPNPTNDLLTIETGIIGQHSIQITSLNGQLMYSTKMEGTSHQIDLSSFQRGVYLITIRSKDFVTTRKIIKL